MLTAIRLQDFKNHVDTEVRVGRLTCLAGPNGCGKTGVLQGIDFALSSLWAGAASVLSRDFVPGDLPRVGERAFGLVISAMPSTQAAASGRTSETLEIMLSATPDVGALAAFAEPWINVDGHWKRSWRDVESGNIRTAEGEIKGDDPEAPPGQQRIGIGLRGWHKVFFSNEFLPRSFLFQPQIAALRHPSKADTDRPMLAQEGANLPSVIAYLIATEPDAFALLMQRIREVLPRVQRIRTRPAKVQLNEPAQVATKGKTIHYEETREYPGHELLFDLTDAPGIPARAVSEGTLLVTALLTATVWNQGAGLLLIDDLEKGLHPRAQRELVAALKRLLARETEMQVVFSTHSPYIIDELDADQVWIMVADDARGVIARRLSDHPRAEAALQVLTTGEFLDAEGEDWVRDTPAAA